MKFLFLVEVKEEANRDLKAFKGKRDFRFRKTSLFSNGKKSESSVYWFVKNFLPQRIKREKSEENLNGIEIQVSSFSHEKTFLQD